MKELNFSTGDVTYSINGKLTITFNPTDTNLAKRLNEAFSTLDEKQESYKEQVKNLSDNKEIFEFSTARDKEMREILDGIFNVPVCDALFGAMNVYSLAGGFPVWCNFLLAILDEMEAKYTEENSAANPRLEKYMAKYQKYIKK